MKDGRLFNRSPPKYRVPLERHPVKQPWGAPDKRGNLFWEKMHKCLDTLPKEYRGFFNYITLDARPEHPGRAGKGAPAVQQGDELLQDRFRRKQGKVVGDG